MPLNLSFLDSDTDEPLDIVQDTPLPEMNNDENIDGFSNNDDDDGDNDDDREHIQTLLEELVDESELHDLLTDFSVEVNTPIENIQKVTGPIYLITWLCLFLALWQYTFSITDTAFEHLIKFLKAFLNVLAQRFDGIGELAAFMPSSLYMFFNHIGCDSTPYKKCFTLYSLEDCITKIQGVPHSKLCSNVLYPNHTQSTTAKRVVKY